MYDFYLEERRLIQPGYLVEIRFEDLEKDFLKGLARIYEQLNLDGWQQFEPLLKNYLKSQSPYRKNKYHQLSEALKQKINTTWSKTFEEWNYSVQ